MGCGNSSGEDKEAAQRNKELEKQLKEDAEKAAPEGKLLLLGGGECGKSTVLKQMKIVNMEGYTKKDYEDSKEIVYSNTITSLGSIISAMESCGSVFDADQNREQDAGQVLDKIHRMADTEPFEPELLAAMKRLWADT